ncbi:MAG: hypothetical protein CVU39_20185 [Chloroflexi bacterium HGW-Chloroflexi-10]|nr:MAG: hypothetical protein CVU39_20185 [Chloroflexi bacterium HGW-Chloroflexi-10]
MSTTEIESAVFEIVAKVAKREQRELSLETKIAEDLGLKSMSRIELAALLEDRFPIQIDNFEIRLPKTIVDVVDLVKKKMI